MAQLITSTVRNKWQSHFIWKKLLCYGYTIYILYLMISYAYCLLLFLESLESLGQAKKTAIECVVVKSCKRFVTDGRIVCLKCYIVTKLLCFVVLCSDIQVKSFLTIITMKFVQEKIVLWHLSFLMKLNWLFKMVRNYFALDNSIC